ncbi:amidohydrolase [bacterium]|nr:amidohydrolase [bacterium]MBU1063614.1 amidohydrolase [bacterium]MBU1635769.1 amidohydrolase [bacterium]MBU1873699.1 amidohydrolase [bacterium]
MKTTIITFPVVLVIFISIFSCKHQEKIPVTLAIINANIWTADENQPFAEAVAISDGKIVYVGTTKQVKKTITKESNVIDAAGMFICPGFTDSHLHLLDGGFHLSSVQLRDANTPEEFITRIADFAKTCEPGDWILGGDWDHSLWGGELPNRHWIDEVTPVNPLWVSRLDGHMVLANSLALKIANINKNSVSPAGGTIVKDGIGELTGIFKDNAMDLIYPYIKEPGDSLKFHALDAAMQYLIERGVTSVHHMGGWDDLRIYRHYHDENKLRIRISAAVPLSTWKKLDQTIQENDFSDEWLRIGGLKSFVDGSLGSHTALFHEPYTDKPTDTGLQVTRDDELFEMILNADKAGLQSITHAIGDKANTIILDIYEQVKAQNGNRDRRFRIEHAQHLRNSDIQRFRKLGVIASMQPYHAIDDGRWAEPLIGDRIKTTHAYRSLLDAGTNLVFGSDWYVAPPSPLWGIYAAITRRTLDDKNPDGWVPEQKISVEEALKCYTISPAYASFEESIKGSIMPGKLADLVIIDQDLTKIDPVSIKDSRIMMTIVDGKIQYQSK